MFRAAYKLGVLLIPAIAGGCNSTSTENTLRSTLSSEPGATQSALASDGAGRSKTGPIARGFTEQLTASATPGADGYRIGPQDVLEITVFKVAELSTTAQVSDTGTVNFPLIGEVKAGGRTSQEIERDLAKQLGAKYLQRPQVRVFVKEFNSQRITVEGAVRKPGVFPYRGNLTLLQLVAMAEGLNEISETTILVFRNRGGKRAAAKFDVAEIRTGTMADPAVEPGDAVVVPTSAVKEAFQTVLRALPLRGVFSFL